MVDIVLPRSFCWSLLAKPGGDPIESNNSKRVHADGPDPGRGKPHFVKHLQHLVVLSKKDISNNFQNYEQIAKVILEL